MWADRNCVQNMSLTIDIDRFTRLKQTIAGKFAPRELPFLAEYLAGDDGEINYSMDGNLAVDQAGSQERQVKCIISGWFLLFDPVTLAPVRHTLNIRSALILVNDESGLPPLEMESETEDYIVCGAKMAVAGRVEEEILLGLPANAVNRGGMIDLLDNSAGKNTGIGQGASRKNLALAKVPVAEGRKISPFAKLAELKKTGKI